MPRQNHDRRENFPVAGWFIARADRPLVRAYYAFARSSDDIADDPDLPTSTKLARLDEIAATQGEDLFRDLDARGIDRAVGTGLLMAFRADARGDAIETAADLDAYCKHSAAPVGRFLLALHGETAATRESDALCAALQVLNHVQDAHDDWLRLKRCYLPRSWQAEAGFSITDVDHDPAARDRVLVRMIDHADALLSAAAGLPDVIRTRRLAAQCAAILALARRLSWRLRQGDPWRRRVDLTPGDWAAAAFAGVARFIGHRGAHG
jgi:phytoene/squalene synthetase